MALLEADTDGVYFAAPLGWTPEQERGVVAATAALLPEGIRLEYEGRYQAMFVHEVKNYALLTYGDRYMHLADLASYMESDAALCALYRDGAGWARKAILNVAASGKFSSDRTIAQYAAEIWNAKPCPVA